LKNERVHGSRYETRDAARADVFEYIEVFYNRVRRHTSLGGVSPVSFYERWLNQQSKTRQAAQVLLVGARKADGRSELPATAATTTLDIHLQQISNYG